MTYAPTKPLDVPPYQLQSLISAVIDSPHRVPTVQVRCAQALGSEIYVGCSNGELLRFALQANNPDTPGSYTLLSRQTLPNDKPIDEIVLTPSISRALILSDHQVHFYTLPALDMVPSNMIKPIRNVVTLAVDEQHIRRPSPSLSDIPVPIDPIEFCVIKRNAIAMYSLREKLFFHKEIPLPSGGILARRTGRHLCVADKVNYNMIDLEAASLFPLLPLSQDIDSTVTVKPSITVISENEFLILSWTGGSTLGVFITGDGDPVRGTLEWPSHPQAVCLDYPYITTLLPNNTIEIHSVETQSIIQVVAAPPDPPSASSLNRKTLVACPNGFFVPSTQRSDKLRRTPVRLLRGGTETRKDSESDVVPEIPAI
ncbi:Transforming growth factor-beta receptor-associated protein 1 [Grifola frondosa]|uniref:Transforming growth factor-beta receptor-associated protein 1 n=1 Tax=Grifola frondosa TaxID=5627 RepID=A0A1C7LXX3_GRIFR|nr:Transforming growth factor-beta receptor-associated protein 1 [Grifola frondosa]